LNWTKTFQGGEENAATGLVNFNNRDYNLHTFTWNTADPLGYVDGLSRYPFVAGNPINRLDPLGTTVFVKCSINDYLKSNDVTGYKSTVLTENKGWTRYSGDATFKNGGDVTSEILATMIKSGRTFWIKDGSLDNLKLQVKARLGIVAFAAQKAYTFGAGKDFKSNPDYWNNGGTLKTGVSQFDALNDLNSNPAKYVIACYFATWATELGGIANALGKQAFDKLNLDTLMRNDSSDDKNDWIPGDWGWIMNTNFKQGRDTPGLEGENIIYTGGGQFWGHFGPGNTYQSLDDWMKDVRSWPNAASKLGTRRTGPSVGLQSNGG
jgi:RHS repeat-associated protein